MEQEVYSEKFKKLEKLSEKHKFFMLNRNMNVSEELYYKYQDIMIEKTNYVHCYNSYTAPKIFRLICELEEIEPIRFEVAKKSEVGGSFYACGDKPKITVNKFCLGNYLLHELAHYMEFLEIGRDNFYTEYFGMYEKHNIFKYKSGNAYHSKYFISIHRYLLRKYGKLLIHKDFKHKNFYSKKLLV